MDLIDVVKKRLGLRFDRELAEMLGMSGAALSERRRKNSFPVESLRQLLIEKSIDTSFLDSLNKEMKTDSSNTMSGSLIQRLEDKERIITIQQQYIKNLEKTIGLLEEDKKKRNQTNVPEYINQPDNWATVPM